jgi:hypothetical protein
MRDPKLRAAQAAARAPRATADAAILARRILLAIRAGRPAPRLRLAAKRAPRQT